MNAVKGTAGPPSSSSSSSSSPSLSRKERAAETRRRILDSALASFTEHGYSVTTMEKVAARAGVAVQTVYFAFRTKGELLQAVYADVVLGPDQTPPHLMPWWPRPDDGHDIGAAVSRLVDGTLELLARAAPLVWSVLGDDGAREGYEHNEQLRRFGYAELVAVLSAKHSLRAGLTPIRARDLLLVLTGPQLFVQFIGELGWSTEELSTWITTAVLEQVFGLPRPPESAPRPSA